MAPPSIETLAQEIYFGFIVPCAEAREWHGRYKWMNRAAASIAMAARLLGYPDDDASRAGVADQIADGVLELLADSPFMPRVQKEIAKGLPERAVKCLIRYSREVRP